jgi:hypothetical protein
LTLAPPTSYTATTGNFLTSAVWNTQVRDATGFLSAVPVFRGFQTAAQSFASSTAYAPILLDSESFDPEGGHSTSTNTSRFVVQTAGYYYVTAFGSYSTNATGGRAIAVAVNGTATVQSQQAPPPANSWAGGVNWLGYLNVGDYVEATSWQNSGTSVSMATGAFAASLSLFWVAR